MSTEIRRIMSQQDRDEGSRILATSFMKLNRLWHNVLPNYEDACQVYYIKLALSMGQGMAYGFYLDGKLIGVKTNFPLEYYLSIPKKPSKIKIFNLLNTYSTEIEKSIPYHEAGEAAFGTLLAMAPEYGSKGYSMELALEAMKTMQQSGYKVWYGWVSNPVSRFMCQKLGGEELSEVKMTETEVKGGWLVLIKIDLTKELPRLDDLRKSFISPRL